MKRMETYAALRMFSLKLAQEEYEKLAFSIITA